MMYSKAILAFGVAFGTAMLAAIGADIYQNRQVAKKVDLSVKDLKTATKADIQEGIVRKAVEDAANSSVSDYLRAMKADILGEARQKLNDEARKAVRDAGAQIQREVGERISTEASLIDMTALKKSARDKAEAKILEKFDGNLEDLLEKFNDNLSNVQKIYGGIADAITKTKEQSNGIKFTIG